MDRIACFSIIVPILNEAGNLESLLSRLVATCRSTARWFEIILVDDGSTDSSPDLLKAAVKEHPGQIVAVLLDRNYGQHAAIFAGFRQARGDVCVTIDADLQNPPEEIPRLLARIEEGYDVVGTVRRNRRDPLHRRLASGIMNRFSSVLCGVKMHDYGCMLRGYRRPVVEGMLLRARRRVFIPVLANYFARRSSEIDVEHAPRRSGISRYSVRKLVRLQLDLLMGRPRRAAVGPGESLAGPAYVIKAVVGESQMRSAGGQSP